MDRKPPRPTLHLSSHQARHVTRCRERNRETAPSSRPPACLDTTKPEDSRLTAPQILPSASAHDGPTHHRAECQSETQSHPGPARPNRAHRPTTRANSVPCSERPSPSPERQWHGKMQTPFNTSYCDPDTARPYTRKVGASRMAELVKREAYRVKRFELSVRYERRFTNDENRTRWAASGAEHLKHDSLPPLLIG